MAGRADVQIQILAQRGTSLERVAAAAGHVDLGVLGMDVGFHGALQRGREVYRADMGSTTPFAKAPVRIPASVPLGAPVIPKICG